MKIGTQIFGGASCEISFCNFIPNGKKKEIRQITNLQCDPAFRGQGHARQLMEAICREADQRRMILVIMPGPYGEDAPMSKEQLTAWYANSFGFNPIQNEPIVMARMYEIFVKPILADKISQIIHQGQ